MTRPVPGLGGVVGSFAAGVPLPEVRLVRRRTAGQRVPDVYAATRVEVARLVAGEAPGARGPIAVGVGSRGISELPTLVRAVIDELRASGYEPFVVPAMGSHGGATPEGQTQVLADYGVTAETMGVPVRATMDTEVIDTVAGVPVHTDAHVVAAGRAFLVCRVKPHTDFSGPFESGAVKMAAIGMGKQSGAQTIHSRGVAGLRDLMPRVGRIVAGRFVVGAVAVVENEDDEIAHVRGLARDEIGGAAESALLDIARGLLPRLPFEDLDVLVVDRIGKDISGTCMDPNVLGRWMMTELPDPPSRVRCIVALDLTPASHGNGLGIGLADIAPQRLVDRLDLEAMYVNALTSGWAGLKRSRLPMVLPTDRDAVLAAVALYGASPARPLRLAWIQDTLHTQRIAISEALLPDVRLDDGLVVAGPPTPLPFDASGRLASLSSLDRPV